MRSTKESRNAEYILRCREVLSYKIILANILKECTDEFGSFDVRYIMDNCIQGNAEIAEMCTDEEAREDECYQKPFYDLRFYASVPETGEFLKFIIKIDLSGGRRSLEYRVRKGMFYSARMIAFQDEPEGFDTVFDDSMKAYTIWICPDETGKLSDSAVCFGSSQRLISGKKQPQTDGSITKVAVINLDCTVPPSQNERSVTDLLKTVLKEKYNKSDMKILGGIYGITGEDFAL